MISVKVVLIFIYFPYLIILPANSSLSFKKPLAEILPKVSCSIYGFNNILPLVSSEELSVLLEFDLLFEQ